MDLTILIALIFVLVGVVFAIRNGEYRAGTFWLICSIILLDILPRLVTFNVH